MNEVTAREFSRAVELLSKQVADVQQTGRETLAQTKITNGRVTALEVVTSAHGAKIANVERQILSDDANDARRSEPITRRDLAVAGGVVFLLVEVVRWVPAMLAAGKVAP